MRYKRSIILVVLVGAFLAIRQWLDRKREKIQDTEIVRADMDDGDAHLGSWAQKNTDALIRFRLKRDGSFTYEVIEYPKNDTIKHTGRYEIITTTDDRAEHPWLKAVSDNGDTIINHSIYLTRATKKDVDILALKKSNQRDAPAILFYRIDGNSRGITLNELEDIQAEDKSEWENNTAKRDALTAIELIKLSDCDDLPCVQLFMKDLSPDFTQGKKGEYNSGRNSVVIDTAGIEHTIPLSTFYIDTNPQASWRAAHTIHKKNLGDALYNEFTQLGFKFESKGRYTSPDYPGKSLYIKATYNPWGNKGLYQNGVTWACYVFEVYTDR